MKKILLSVAILGLTGFICSANAQSAAPGGQGKAAMAAACQGKSEGSACTFTGRRDNTIKGSCMKRAKGEGVLLCMPKVPKKALTACEGKAEGDKCTIERPVKGNISGTCHKGPRTEGALACRPDRKPQ